MEYLFHKWPRVCSTQLVVNTSRSFPHSRLITGFVTRLTRRVPLVEQELHTLPEHPSSSPVFSGVRVTQSLVLYVCFVDRCLSFCTFFFWPLCCLFFFDIRFLIAPLVSSNSSYLNQKLSCEMLDQVVLQILLFSTVSFMFLVYHQLSVLSVLLLNLSTAVYSAGSIPSNHS